MAWRALDASRIRSIEVGGPVGIIQEMTGTRCEEAVRLDEETLSIRERVMGPEHPDNLSSRSNLASGYRDLVRYEEAVRLDEETLSIRERVLGPENPDTLTSRRNLAQAYRAEGRNTEADELDMR